MASLPPWPAILACGLVILALAQSAAMPTTDTLVVTKASEESTPTPAPNAASTTEVKAEPTTEGPLPPVKMTEMTVNSEVSLRYAHTAVVTKVRNPAKRAQEATFRVLLPETAFISGFVMTLDGKSYKAYVKEKEEAKQIFSDAVSHGFGAAHIAAKARDSNHFTVSVNIEPNTSAVFNLTYEELLVRRNNLYNHAINLLPGALVPKLTVKVHIKEAQKITVLRVPEVRTGNEIDATEQDPQNSKAVIERGHDDREATITFTPDLEEQKRLMEIYAEKSKESQSRRRILYDEEEKKPEGVLGQFVVQYDVDRPKDGEILVNDGYFVHFFAPPSLPPLNKHVVFVLDTSGSMMDRKIVQLREAMATILGELNRGDYFSIVEFSTYVQVHDLKEAEGEPPKPPSWDSRPESEALVPPAPATPDNIARAKVIVSRLQASGGTNIGDALDVAVNLTRMGIDWKPAESPSTPATTSTTEDPDENAETVARSAPKDKDVAKVETKQTDEPKKEEPTKLEPIIIFLTDGDPTVGQTDPARIITRLSETNYGDNKATIFSLAFGEDADRSFLRKLSLRNAGFMRHIYEAADAALQLRDLYRQVASPLLAHLAFTYPKEQVKEGSVTKSKFRSFYAGGETVVAGRLASEDTSELSPSVEAFCGVDDSNKRKKYAIFPRVPTARPAGTLPLERLWAYLTVKQLLDQRDADDSPASDAEDTPEKKALSIALKYEFVTPLTSLVVVKPNATNAVNAESVDSKDGGGFPRPGTRSGGPGHGSLLNALTVNRSSFSSNGWNGPAGYSSNFHSGNSFGSGFSNFGSGNSNFGSGFSNFGSGNSNFGSGFSNFGTSSSNFGSSSWSFAAGQPGSAFQSNIMIPGSGYGGNSAGGWKAWSSTPQMSSFSRGVLPAGYGVETTERPSTTPMPIKDRLKLLGLEQFPWVAAVLMSTKDAIVVNATKLELTRFTAPRDLKDMNCEAPAAGVCVYLTRCADATNITLQQYEQSYCFVNNMYAGVCCPKDKVDAPLPATTPAPPAPATP